MNEESLFHQALAIDDPAQREAFLDQACHERPEMRQAVARLLAAHEQTGSFLNRPAAVMEVPTDAFEGVLPLEKAGERIGPYKLLQKIGEGGMGTVWMAEQEQPVRRRVALKIIKPGMDSAQIIARFEAERQALAMMDHLNIAKVLDAGATTAGRPYFVMELVHGVPITRYCDENKLSPKERLELFIPVCQAIQHAHQKGIIHRDIKPSNVLVTLYDGRPVPKVIDFGVAKAVEQRLTDKTMFTQYGQIVGTLEYMSPEQAEMSALGVDTRSDVYSLGVLLYELLTGTTPVNRKQLREAAFVEILRMIKEDEPQRPSVRLSTTEELATIAASRGIDPPRLTRLVKGDLDWIVMKCLEKDRTRRYETAVQLARDVEHFLRDEPVDACPPSLWYRWRKFARRHRTAMTAASIAFWCIIASQVVTAWYAYKAAVANDANRVLAQGLQIAYDNAIEEQKRAEEEKKKAEEARQAEAGLRAQLDQSLNQRTLELRRSEAWRLANTALLKAGQQPEIVGPLVRSALRLHDDVMTRSTCMTALQDIPLLKRLPRALEPFDLQQGLQTFHNTWWFTFSPDGRYLVSPSSDLSRIGLYNAQTWRFQGSFNLERMDESSPSELLVSPKSDWLALAGIHQAHWYDFPSGRLRKKWAHAQPHYHVKALTASRDGQHVAALFVETDPQQAGKLPDNHEHEIWLWSAPHWEGKRLYATREPDLHAISLSSDGQRLAALHRAGQRLLLLQTATGDVQWTRPVSAKIYYTWLQFAANDEAICLPSPKGVLIHPVEDGPEREVPFPGQLHLPNGCTMVVSGDGQSMLISPYAYRMNLSQRGGISMTGPLHVWDLKELAFRQSLGESQEYYGFPQISADGRIAAAVDGRLRLWAWDTATGQLFSRPSNLDVGYMALQPNGRTAAVNNLENHIMLVDLEQKGILPTIHMPIREWLLTDTSRTLLLWDASHRLWNFDTNKFGLKEAPRPASQPFNHWQFPWQNLLAGGKRLLTGPSLSQVQLLDTASGQALAAFSPASLGIFKPRQRNLIPRQGGNSFLLVIPKDANATMDDWTKLHPSDLIVYDAFTGKERSRVVLQETLVGFYEGAFSEDGRWLAFLPAFQGKGAPMAPAADIVLWDAEQQRIADCFRFDVGRGQKTRVEGLAFSAKAQWLAVWDSQGFVHLRHRTTKQWTKSVKVSDQPIRSAAMSEDGRWVAAYVDGEFILWETTTDQPRFRIATELKTPQQVFFVAEDAMVLTVGDRFQLWPVDLARHLEQLGIRDLSTKEQQHFAMPKLP